MNSVDNTTATTTVKRGRKPKVVEPVVAVVDDEEEEVEVEEEEEVSEIEEEEELSDIEEDEEEEEDEQTDEGIDEEVAELERKLEEARMKKRQKEVKSRLADRAGEVVKAFVDMVNADIDYNLEIMNKHRRENEAFEKKLKMLERVSNWSVGEVFDTENNEAVMKWFCDNEPDFANDYLFKDEDKPKKNTSKSSEKSEKSEKSDNKKGTRTVIDRKKTLELLKNKMVFRASALHKTDKSNRVEMDLVFDAKRKVFVSRYTKKVYNLLQDANREWCGMRGLDKLGNAWEDFKALNLTNGDTRSIRDINDDNWIEDSISNNYIDEKFQF